MTDQRVLPRALVVLLCTAGAVVTLAGIREIGSIVGPVLLALVLVLAVSPVRTRLRERGAPGWTLVAVPLAIVLLVLLGMVAILTVAVAQMAALAPPTTRSSTSSSRRRSGRRPGSASAPSR